MHDQSEQSPRHQPHARLPHQRGRLIRKRADGRSILQHVPQPLRPEEQTNPCRLQRRLRLRNSTNCAGPPRRIHQGSPVLAHRRRGLSPGMAPPVRGNANAQRMHPTLCPAVGSPAGCGRVCRRLPNASSGWLRRGLLPRPPRWLGQMPRRLRSVPARQILRAVPASNSRCCGGDRRRSSGRAGVGSPGHCRHRRPGSNSCAPVRQ